MIAFVIVLALIACAVLAARRASRRRSAIAASMARHPAGKARNTNH